MAEDATAQGLETQRIGWVGTGVMGASMCGHVLKAGHSVTVNTRTKSKAEALISAGATWADTPAEVAAASDITFTIVGFPDDVRSVYLDDDGLLAGAKAGSILVDCTTSSPELAKEIAERASGAGVTTLDAPVSGGDVGAKNGTLSIMVGGHAVAFSAVKPLLDLMGSTVVLQGGPGAGQHTKMVNQTVIASTMVGVCEALLYAFRAGLDPNTVLESIGGGAAASWSLTNLAPRILDGDFEPGFYVEHFVKDMGIALAEAERMQLRLPGLVLANTLYSALAELEHARSGTQALLLALASLSDVEWPSASTTQSD